MTRTPATPATPVPGHLDVLSGRQRQVIAMIADGLSNKEISQRLFITPNTVKAHIRVAYGAIGVKTRAQAVRWYLTGEGGR